MIHWDSRIRVRGYILILYAIFDMSCLYICYAFLCLRVACMDDVVCCNRFATISGPCAPLMQLDSRICVERANNDPGVEGIGSTDYLKKALPAMAETESAISLAQWKKTTEPAQMKEAWKDLTVPQACWSSACVPSNLRNSFSSRRTGCKRNINSSIGCLRCRMVS